MFQFQGTYEPSEKAQEVGEDLLAIKEINGGLLHPCDVVDAARDEESPLHSYFEWDDSIAAEHHRQGQARKLITSIVIVRKKGKKLTIVSTPVFTHLRADGSGYRETTQVYNTPDLKHAYIVQLKRDWLTFKQKHDDVLKEIKLFEEFDSSISDL